MTEYIQPLFGSAWSSNIPTDFKSIFLSSSDTETNPSRKQSNTMESIILDEEYEILQSEVQTSAMKTCPLCLTTMTDKDVQIYSCVLETYFDVHSKCAINCKRNSSRLHNFGSKPVIKAMVSERMTLDHDLTLVEGPKVFIELAIFHPISSKALIRLNNTCQLSHKRNNQSTAIIVQDYVLSECGLYQPKKVYVPLLQGRIEVDITIMDSNVIQAGKGSHKFEFFYDVTQIQNEEITLQVDTLKLSLTRESKDRLTAQNETGYDFNYECNQVLQLKYLQLTIDELLNLVKPVSPKRSNFDSFLFSPKLSVKTQYTPQIVPLANPRARFQSLQLEEAPASPSEWTEEMGSIELIRGNIVNFVKTQHGSRLIQKYFTTCTQTELDQLLYEIAPNLSELMIDPYANYMFGCLSQSCAPTQRQMILQQISPRLVEIACDKKGTHAVQSLISLVSSRQEEDLIEQAIKNNIITLVLDSQGTHLIKKIIARFSDEKLALLFYKLMDKFLTVVNHQFGLCVLKDIITRFKNNQEKSNYLLNKMASHIDDIVQDPFGNYAIQHAIDTFGDLKCGQIIDRILSKIIQLSIHKYSSNVVEKCILETSQKTQKRFIKALSQENVCLELMKNKFGSFVLQKALHEAEKLGDHEGLLSSLHRNLSSLYATSVRIKWADFLQRK